jgi:protease-4
MKEFFKFVLASFVGTFIAFAFAGIVFFLMIIVFVSLVQFSKKDTVSSNTVLELKFDYMIPERTRENPLSNFDFQSIHFRNPLGLNGIISNIRKAKNDNNVEGIYLNLNNFDAGALATIETVRNELLDFKKSGKFIIAYGANIDQKAYYLASAADKIYLSPIGSLDFKGLAAEQTFFKNTLDKLDIEAQIFQHGKFKSATEPFRLDKMSDENRTQVSDLISSMFNYMIENISAARNLKSDNLKEIADGLLIRTAEDAVKYKLVDGLVYEDQVISELKHRTGVSYDRKLRTVSLQDYANVKVQGSSSKNRIAVIYANGEISGGSGDDDNIGLNNITDAIRAARLDDNVKAIVMRVNSPGGDALTSDLIWREVTLAKKSKPFIVSMGDVAASGGYYISCAADTIVAEPNTITGSIGVFGIIPNLQKFFSNKLGITFDRAKTGKYSDMMTATRPLTPEEKLVVQNDVDRIYKVFVTKASEGRHLKYEQVDEIGQGRIWTGLQAKKNGLVDVIGGIRKAIEIASRKAKLKNYVIVEYPRMKQLFESLFDDISTEAGDTYLRNKLGNDFKYYNYLKEIENIKGIQARLPFKLEVY